MISNGERSPERWAYWRRSCDYACVQCGLAGPKQIRCPQCRSRPRGENASDGDYLTPRRVPRTFDYREERKAAYRFAFPGTDNMPIPARLADFARMPWLVGENVKGRDLAP